MSYTPTFHPSKSGVGTTLTALGATYATGPVIAVVSAVVDFYLNYDDDAITNRFFVESSGQPFRIIVDDLSKLHVAAVSGTVNLFIHTYPINAVVP
jgi:hypothetical protein